MIWADIAVVTIAYAGACALQAAWQAKRFKEQLTISHFWHAIYYGVFCGIISGLYALQLDVVLGLVFLVYGVAVRYAFFDVILNLIRGNELWYNGDDEYVRTDSLQDWWENKVLRLREPGGNRRILILRLCYLISWVICLILIIIYAINKKL